MQLFVLGMHRSGTSAFTRILNMAGAYFGPEGISNGADSGNPKGFWERLDIRRLCDGLLQDSGFDWWRLSGFSLDAIPEEVRETHLPELRKTLLELDAHRPWVIKEPRLSLLLPLVLPLLEVPVCIHVSREPLEVAESLRVRNGLPVSVGLALWERYTISAFEASDGLPRLLVRYEDLMADPKATVARLLDELVALGVQGLRVPSDRELDAFLTADLHRQHRSAEERSAWLTSQQAELAIPHDEARIPERHELGPVSEGGLSALRSFEEARDELGVTVRGAGEALAAADNERAEAEQATAEALYAVRAAGEAELAQARAETAEVESELDQERDTTDRRFALVDQALGRAERQTRLLARSRAWRVADSVARVNRRLSSDVSQSRGPVEKLAADIRRARNQLVREPRDDEEAPAGPAPASSSGVTSSLPRGDPSPPRPSVAVLAWDVGHNPLGRAHVMADLLSRHADVEIWGAQFERYGRSIWAPLAHSATAIHTFPGRSFPDHLKTMEEVAASIEADVVWASKARFPSLGLGVLAKQARDRPLILDVDDHEVSFFGGASGIDPASILGRAAEDDVALPFGQAWTQACESMIGAVDQLTVSNVTLQERFGGMIVPHARDERVFDPSRYDRSATRRSLGVDPSCRLLLFGGTPRVHKGVVEVVRALDRLGDDRYRLLCFGTREFEDVRRAIGDLERWTIVLPNQAFDDLPPLVAAADLACVLQDPAHPVSRYQMPAKITDALAMAVPLLVRPVPPLASLVEADVVNVDDGVLALHERIDALFADPAGMAERAARGRELFLAAFSYEAVGAAVATMLAGHLDHPVPLSDELAAFVELPRRVFAANGPIPADRKAKANGATPLVRQPGRRRRAVEPGAIFDVLVFWKQNDTGIYGRRQDMFVKYLARSERIATIVHFDRPTTPEDLLSSYRGGKGATDQRRLVAQETVARLFHRRDLPKVHHRTYLHGGPRSARLGFRPEPAEIDYVRSTLARLDVGTRPTILWGYPTNDELPGLIDALDPDVVLTDVVDDHRTFAPVGSDRYRQFDCNYREVLARSDVILANCAPVAVAMTELGHKIHVVANGCEIRPLPQRRPKPPELSGLHGPVIGYVGNLSQRLDVDLLDDLVMAHPDWQFVFVGSAHHDRSVLVLESEPNVHFVGVKRYEVVLDFIDHFNVALIPHLVNDITRSMNPLKAFVYGSAGVPIVSTPVANLAELDGLITVADGPKRFGEAIDAALRSGRRTLAPEVLSRHSWENRVDHVLALIDRSIGERQDP